MADITYNRFKGNVADTGAAYIDWLSDTIKVMLVGSGYTPNADDDFADTPAASEISVSGYTSGFAGSGRKTLSSKTITIDDTNDRGALDAADVTWTALGSGATIAGAVVYKHITNDASSPLIAYFDLTDTPTNGGDVTIQWASIGLLTLT